MHTFNRLVKKLVLKHVVKNKFMNITGTQNRLRISDNDNQ